ncbi:MAG: HNH endonuclease [Mycoplasma sp.]|nr:HNH endonuclease [Mycoplasma sp.]
MKNCLVKVELLFFQKNKGQKVRVDAFFPVVNNVIYRPYKFLIKSGYLSGNHRKNTSIEREKDRLKKEELLKEITIETEKNHYEIIKQKWFRGQGIITFIKKLTGSNQNKHANLYIVNTEYNEFSGLKIAMLFQDPKSISDIDFSNYDEISFDDFVLKNSEYCYLLNDYYYENIKTCSTNNPIIAFNKNGQAKTAKKIKEDIKKSINFELGKIKENIKKNVREISYVASIMNAFKKNLDMRFNYTRATRKCIICGIQHPNMLVASHIKARAESKNNIDEQIDGNNGFWLCAQHDRAFDRRLITFDNNGKIIQSFDIENIHIFPNDFKLKHNVVVESKKYLDHHRKQFNYKFK